MPSVAPPARIGGRGLRLPKGGRSQRNKKIIGYLFLVVIGTMCSIVFRFNLFQFWGLNNIFLFLIIVFACIFLFFVLTIIIKRIVFLRTYLMQVREGVTNNLCSKSIKPL